jgi:hypothetical protein
MIHKKTRVYSLALAVSAALAGSAHAGREIITTDKKVIAPVEQPKVLTGSISAGWSSRYIFRGTNLMPSADGMVSTDLHVNYGGFTLGAWMGTQMGTASVPGALAIGEGGGGGSADFGVSRGNGLSGLGSGSVTGDQLVSFIAQNFGLTHDQVVGGFSQILNTQIPKQITNIKRSSEAFQDRFNEVDLYAQYAFSLGPVDITLGNIFFYIDRDSETQLTGREYFASEDARNLITALAGNPGLLPGSTRLRHPEDFLLNNGRKVSRRFDGIGDERFDRLFVSVSTTKIPYIVPRVTYYQTIYSEGQNPEPQLGVFRNDRKGGYLEAKINGEIPIIKDRLNLDPYALISYSSGDRSARDGASLDGWNHFQAGAELVWQVTDTFRFIPQINYMNHISDPPLGTNEDEWWGGARAEIVFGGPATTSYELPDSTKVDDGKTVDGKVIEGGKKQILTQDEQGDKLSGSISAGYSTRYIFRGTNLMPSADGMVSTDLHVNYGGFTIGSWIGSQIGSASVPGALAIGEGGGGGQADFGVSRGNGLGALGSGSVTGDQLVNFIAQNFGLTHDQVVGGFSQILNTQIPKQITNIKRSSEAFQDRFNEVDLYAQYSLSLGPVDVTLGNIFFYIDRDSSTQLTGREYFASEDARNLITALAGNPGLLPGSTRQGNPEDFLLNNGRKVSKRFDGIGDETFDRLFISVSTTKIPYVVPRLTYYQTVYSEGKNPDPELHVFRNDRKGGYLEAKVNGEIPIIKNRLNLDPYALVSFSSGDRSDKNGSSLDGWNHFQVGAELVWQVSDRFRVIPQINWMSHISDPPLGTNEDDWWGGARAEVTF